jgi:hypothetical protein
MRSALWSMPRLTNRPTRRQHSSADNLCRRGRWLIGRLVDVGLRSHADGCDCTPSASSRLVRQGESVRAQGIGKQLIVAAESVGWKQGWGDGIRHLDHNNPATGA